MLSSADTASEQQKAKDTTMPVIPLNVVHPARPQARQQPFTLVVPLVRAALLLGAGGGFLLAAALTITSAINVPLGPWWTALAQAHGHLQLYGWALLLVMGVFLHVFPRLRGAPLAYPPAVRWIVIAQVASLLLRVVCQPLLTLNGAEIWRLGLMLSGVCELGALGLALGTLGLTVRLGPSLRARPALHGVLPLMGCAWVALGIAAITNLINVAQTTTGIIAPVGDNLNVALGLFGFLVPVALAMSAQFLPMYAGLTAFPQRPLWGITASYMVGLLLLLVGTAQSSAPLALVGSGMLLQGVAVVIFIVMCLQLMRQRGTVPAKVARLAPSPEQAASTLKNHIASERQNFGPFVGLIASAFLWALFGGALLMLDGISGLLGFAPIFAIDGIRHAFTVGFISLLICGIAPRVLSNFSGGRIQSPRLVWATLWLGNLAALFRAGSILGSPIFDQLGVGGAFLQNSLFGLSGPLGLALAICLAVNLWPTLQPARQQP